MSEISRRTLLTAAPVAVAATMLPTVGAYAITVAIDPETPAEWADHPWTKARALSKALSAELTKVAAWEGTKGWRAHIEPDDARMPVLFESRSWRGNVDEQDYYFARFADAVGKLDPSKAGWTVTRDVYTGAVTMAIARGDTIAEAIARHRASSRELSRLIDEEEAAMRRFHAMAVPAVRVQFGVTKGTMGCPDEPRYVYSHKDIDRETNRFVNAYTDWPGGEARIQQLEGMRSARHRELRNKRRAWQRAQRKAGVPQAVAAVKAQMQREEIAAVALLLACPVDKTQCEAKAAYMKRKAPFSGDWWDADSLMHALKVNLGMVEAHDAALSSPRTA